MRIVRSLAVIAVMLVTFHSLSAQTNLGKVSVDNVTYELSPYLLLAGGTHSVSIRYDFTGFPGSPHYWAQNSFELYSPEGAEWINLTATDGPLTDAVLPPPPDGILRIHKYYSSTDNGGSFISTAQIPWEVIPGDPPDTIKNPTWFEEPGGNPTHDPNRRVAYSLAMVERYGGYSGGTNGIALLLEFYTLPSDDGRTICLDTVSGRGTTPWEWTTGSEVDLPQWDNGLGSNGPRCWAIGSCSPLPPQWCSETSGMVEFAYCEQGSYQLCAIVGNCSPSSVLYSLAPPYDDGNHGSVDPQSGLWSWSGPAVPPGGFYNIEFRAFDGSDYTPVSFILHVQITTEPCMCCSSRVGDADGQGEYPDEVTLGDIMLMVDAKFVSGDCTKLPCWAEADVNQDGGAFPNCENHVTLGDIMALVDFLFISGPENATLPACL